MHNQCCPICGSGEFFTGPGGRLSVSKLPPRCGGCNSLERHRALRNFFVEFRDALTFSEASCLQFSADKSVLPEWFSSHEVSHFDGPNHLDLCDINRPMDSYDVVMCHHVLEHVPDDALAVSEVFRVLSADGVAAFSVPDPARLPATRYWEEPQADRHGHYREYGPEVMRVFQMACYTSSSGQDNCVPSVWPIVTFDTCASQNDLVYLLFKNSSGERFKRFTNAFANARSAR